ncbi:MAG: hypothetical protein IJ287_06255 [Methanobrevibacter sp.]|nr:hypothetical protein [Methanobrevibacter sp.]
MNKKDFDIRKKIINETFDDERKIVASVTAEELDIDDEIHHDGDFFITSNGEIIDLEFQIEDFTEYELVKYIELAEHLYEKYGKKVSIYIICPKEINVYVKEEEIPSESDFTIKLACSQVDSCEIILEGIKDKIRKKELLDETDWYNLRQLPVMCEKSKRNYYRLEYLKIINRYHY